LRKEDGADIVMTMIFVIKKIVSFVITDLLLLIGNLNIYIQMIKIKQDILQKVLKKNKDLYAKKDIIL
jgi:hypothetical protein